MPEKVGFVNEAELRESQPLRAERVGVKQSLDGLRPVGLREQGEARVHLWGRHFQAQPSPLLYGCDERIGKIHERAEGAWEGKAVAGPGQGSCLGRRVEARI
jgi:hypothetical protein